MNNVIEMQEVTWNGLKRDCDAMAEHMRVARSYWPSIATRMAALRAEYSSNEMFSGALGEHAISMNPHNQAAMIEMGKWTQEYLEDCMDNCERTSPKGFVSTVKSWRVPTYAVLSSGHNEQPEPENAPEPAESAEKDVIVESESAKSGGHSTTQKKDASTIDLKALSQKGKSLGVHHNTTTQMKKACELAPSLLAPLMDSDGWKYKGNNTDGKNKAFNPLAMVPGLPPKFASSKAVSVDKRGAKQKLEKMAEDLPKYREIAEAVKGMTPRASEEAAVRLYAGKPLLVPVEKPVAESTYQLLGKPLWPLFGVEETADNLRIVECTLMFMRDWDESLAVSCKNAKGRGITMGQCSKWQRGVNGLQGQIAITYAQILQQHDVVCCARSYADSVMPNGHDVKAKYGL